MKEVHTLDTDWVTKTGKTRRVCSQIEDPKFESDLIGLLERHQQFCASLKQQDLIEEQTK